MGFKIKFYYKCVTMSCDFEDPFSFGQGGDASAASATITFAKFIR